MSLHTYVRTPWITKCQAWDWKWLPWKNQKTEPETRASNQAVEHAQVTHMPLLRAKISRYDTLDSNNLHVPVMRAWLWLACDLRPTDHDPVCDTLQIGDRMRGSPSAMLRVYNMIELVHAQMTHTQAAARRLSCIIIIITENLGTTNIQTCPACALVRAGRNQRKGQTGSRTKISRILENRLWSQIRLVGPGLSQPSSHQDWLDWHSCMFPAHTRNTRYIIGYVCRS